LEDEIENNNEDEENLDKNKKNKIKIKYIIWEEVEKVDKDYKD
jgi:hypothetical protein